MYRPKKKKSHLDNLCAEEGQGGPTRALGQRLFFFGVNWFRTIHLRRVEKYGSQTTIRMIFIDETQVFATVFPEVTQENKNKIHKNSC